MKNLSSSTFTILTKAATRILLGFVLATGTVTYVHAQGQIASGNEERVASLGFIEIADVVDEAPKEEENDDLTPEFGYDEKE